MSLPDLELRPGSDPRGFDAYGELRDELRDELRKLSHPACPDVAWPKVERQCLALFRENGVDLQSAAAFALARTRLHGLSGMEEGVRLIGAHLGGDWERLWPPQVPARLEILAWLFAQLQPLLRSVSVSVEELASVQLALAEIGATLEREAQSPLAPLQSLQEQLGRLQARLQRDTERTVVGPRTAEQGAGGYQRIVYVVAARPAPEMPEAPSVWRRHAVAAGMLASMGAGMLFMWFLSR